jgi:6-pyruvoyltetrahydropterin/6-carboxytetrahydropterin synthase
MYSIEKTFEICGAHKLKLDYESPCQNLHGHNWLVTVRVSSAELNNNEMIMDFKQLKMIFNDTVHTVFDHKNFNELVTYNPTAERLAEQILKAMNVMLAGQYCRCTQVKVQESRDNVAIYEDRV